MYEIFVLSEKLADAYVRIMDLARNDFEEMYGWRFTCFEIIVKEVGKSEDMSNLIQYIKTKYNYEEKLKDKRNLEQNFSIIQKIEKLCEFYDNLKALCAFESSEWCSTYL